LDQSKIAMVLVAALLLEVASEQRSALEILKSCW